MNFQFTRKHCECKWTMRKSTALNVGLKSESARGCGLKKSKICSSLLLSYIVRTVSVIDCLRARF